MGFFQPPVPPLDPSLDLSGQTIIVTGATSGIGLAICRQLLARKAAHLVMAVRNTAKGERVRRELLDELAGDQKTQKPVVTVLELDTERYDSVLAFVSAFRSIQQPPDLHAVLANAGIGTVDAETSVEGHEKDLQVNVLGNALLTTLLLPLLETTAARTGKTTHVSWTGSTMYHNTTLGGFARESVDRRESHNVNNSSSNNNNSNSKENLLQHIDHVAQSTGMLGRYADSKLLVLLWIRQMAEQYRVVEGEDPKNKMVIVNCFCPGHVKTPMTDLLPWYMAIPSKIVLALRGRTPETAADIAIHAATVTGPETHGRFLADMELEEADASSSSWVDGDEGLKLQKMLWNDVMDELGGKATLPAWMKKV